MIIKNADGTIRAHAANTIDHRKVALEEVEAIATKAINEVLYKRLQAFQKISRWQRLVYLFTKSKSKK